MWKPRCTAHGESCVCVCVCVYSLVSKGASLQVCVFANVRGNIAALSAGVRCDQKGTRTLAYLKPHSKNPNFASYPSAQLPKAHGNRNAEAPKPSADTPPLNLTPTAETPEPKPYTRNPKSLTKPSILKQTLKPKSQTQHSKSQLQSLSTKPHSKILVGFGGRFLLGNGIFVQAGFLGGFQWSASGLAFGALGLGVQSFF